MNRLQAMYDTVSALERNNDNMAHINQEAQRMIRMLTVLRVYIAECDEAYGIERAILPLFRSVIVEFSFCVCAPLKKSTAYILN